MIFDEHGGDGSGSGDKTSYVGIAAGKAAIAAEEVVFDKGGLGHKI